MSTYLISAANRGIGLEFARQLAARGDRVIATARPGVDVDALEELDVRVERVDVSSTSSVRALAQKLEGEPLDCLVNNAGVYGSKSSFEELEVDDMIERFQVNSLGAVRMTQAFLPNLRAGSGKKIVSVTSKMGSMADNSSGGSYGYRMSKAALNMFNTSLSNDLAHEGFVCCVVHPGWVQTRMGGSSAPTSVEESVRGLCRVIDELDASKNGGFFDFTGEIIPW